MQAVILAGGRGERLRPLTDQVPKPLIPIKGKPFAQYLVEGLARAGVGSILFCTGYLAEQFPRYFGDGSRWGVKVSYSVEDAPLGTAGALKRAAALLEQRFLILNGDTYLEVDYGRMVDSLARDGWVGLVAAVEQKIVDVRANLSIGGGGAVSCYDKLGASEGLTHVDAGVSAFSREVLGYIPSRGVCSLEQEVFPVLIREEKLGAFPVSHRFWDMGTPDSLEEMSEILK
jgi:NDP-sugar pyrophosphorylase family protein